MTSREEADWIIKVLIIFIVMFLFGLIVALDGSRGLIGPPDSHYNRDILTIFKLGLYEEESWKEKKCLGNETEDSDSLITSLTDSKK